MMTPSQVREYEFKQSGRNAYKADDVDAFIAELSVDYEKMFRENSELVKRASSLAERLKQYMNDEGDIKNAVMSAQKAAEMIIKDAENTASDAKSEADAVLAAAKSEADLIKEDAKKQAIADSELLLAMTRDKAQEIIKKAKEEAGNIILNAKSSASDKVGAATRTVTSETLLYDMLKKEVSEFKASILSQYKAHIELISKLPELASEEAQKLREEVPVISSEKAAEIIEDVPFEAAEDVFSSEKSSEALEFTTEAFSEEGFTENENSESEPLSFEEESKAFEESAVEFVFGSTENEEVSENAEETDEAVEEISFKSIDETTEASETDKECVTVAEEDQNDINEPEKINTDFTMFSGSFDINADDMNENSFFDDDGSDEPNMPKKGSEDIPISRGFTVNYDALERFENKAVVNDDDDEKPAVKKHGLFKRKK